MRERQQSCRCRCRPVLAGGRSRLTGAPQCGLGKDAVREFAGVCCSHSSRRSWEEARMYNKRILTLLAACVILSGATYAIAQ